MRRLGRREFLRDSLTLGGLGLIVGCGAPPFQAPRRTAAHRVGFLSFSPEPASPAGQPGPPGTLAMLAQELRELGYVDGQGLSLHPRYADNREERLPDLATELARLPVDVIVVDFPGALAATRAAGQATDTIPIVSVSVDPEVFRQAELIASVTHPGRNVTGLSVPGPEIRGKQIQLLAEAIPGTTRVGVLWDRGSPATAPQFDATRIAALALGLELQDLGVQALEDVEGAVEQAVAGRADALFVIPSTFLLGAAGNARIIDLVARQRLPALFGGGREHAERGGLMAYWRSIPGVVHRAAAYADKILKGTRPADLPIEGPTQFDFVINLKTAQTLGVTIPQAVLMQATEVIH